MQVYEIPFHVYTFPESHYNQSLFLYLGQKYDSAAAGEIVNTRSFGITGSNELILSFHVNIEDSRPTETASRHYY